MSAMKRFERELGELPAKISLTLFANYVILGLPVLGIYGSSTARSSVSMPIPAVLVSLLATIDTATEGILAQIVSLQGRRGRSPALPLFLNNVVRRGLRRGGFADLIRRVPRRPRWSLRWFVLHRVSFADERDILVDHVVLQIGRAVVVGLRHLRG